MGRKFGSGETIGNRQDDMEAWWNWVEIDRSCGSGR